MCFNGRVMAGGEIIKTQFLRFVQQGTEFQAAIAADTGIGRSSFLIFADKIGDDLIFQPGSIIKNIMTDVKIGANFFASSIAADAQDPFRSPSIKEPMHGRTGDIVTFLDEHPRGNRRINPAAHRHQNFIAHSYSYNHMSKPCCTAVSFSLKDSPRFFLFLIHLYEQSF